MSDPTPKASRQKSQASESDTSKSKAWGRARERLEALPGLRGNDRIVRGDVMDVFDALERELRG